MSRTHLRVYLVDDELLAVERLSRLLEDVDGIEIVGSTTDPVAAVGYLSREPVDAIFLDIQMPGMNGFELLSRLSEQPLVIFTTAYDQYALKAFEVNSIDFLLKPIDPEQLRRALRKLGRLRGGHKPEWMQQPELRSFLQQLADGLRPAPPDYKDRIASRVGERVHLIELSTVTHFFARDKLTYAASAGHNYSVDHTIGDLERKLDPRKFIRIHRSTLLNIDWIEEIHSRFGGQMFASLKDAQRTRLPVARDRVRALKELLEL
jgi:two-component system, LytTR family, response regulator